MELQRLLSLGNTLDKPFLSISQRKQYFSLHVAMSEGRCPALVPGHFLCFQYIATIKYLLRWALLPEYMFTFMSIYPWVRVLNKSYRF